MDLTTFGLLAAAVPILLLVFLYPVWLFIDVAQRRRSKIWMFFGVVFGVLTAPFWLWSRRRSPVVATLSTKQKVGLAALALAALVGVNLFWVAFRTWGFSAARIEGQAMSPTLGNQDRVVVNHFVYLTSSPKIGDIVVHRYPVDPAKRFAKRVLALGGDSVEIRDGRLFRNGRLVTEPYLAERRRPGDRWGPQEVPAGYYFVLGDNRDNSSDSRHWGPVPSGYVLGRVAVRWWPSVGRVD